MVRMMMHCHPAGLMMMGCHQVDLYFCEINILFPKIINIKHLIQFKYLLNLKFSSTLGTHYKLEACILIKLRYGIIHPIVINRVLESLYTNHLLQEHQLFTFDLKGAK